MLICSLKLINYIRLEISACNACAIIDTDISSDWIEKHITPIIRLNLKLSILSTAWSPDRLKCCQRTWEHRTAAHWLLCSVFQGSWDSKLRAELAGAVLSNKSRPSLKDFFLTLQLSRNPHWVWCSFVQESRYPLIFAGYRLCFT